MDFYYYTIRHTTVGFASIPWILHYILPNICFLLLSYFFRLQLFMDYSEANIFKAIDTGSGENEIERNEQKIEAKKRNRSSRIWRNSDVLSRREVFDFFAWHSTPDREDRSLLFAIVSTGHCIRVEGSQSRIEVATEVLNDSSFCSQLWICRSMSQLTWFV